MRGARSHKLFRRTQGPLTCIVAKEIKGEIIVGRGLKRKKWNGGLDSDVLHLAWTCFQVFHSMLLNQSHVFAIFPAFQLQLLALQATKTRKTERKIERDTWLSLREGQSEGEIERIEKLRQREKAEKGKKGERKITRESQRKDSTNAN